MNPKPSCKALNGSHSGAAAGLWAAAGRGKLQQAGTAACARVLQRSDAACGARGALPANPFPYT
jgi:hypothetical protein